MEQDPANSQHEHPAFGRAKSDGTTPARFFTEMSAFVISTRNIYLYSSFVVLLSPS